MVWFRGIPTLGHDLYASIHPGEPNDVCPTIVAIQFPLRKHAAAERRRGGGDKEEREERERGDRGAEPILCLYRENNIHRSKQTASVA
jgi:hypothetical protein